MYLAVRSDRLNFGELLVFESATAGAFDGIMDSSRLLVSVQCTELDVVLVVIESLSVKN